MSHTHQVRDDRVESRNHCINKWVTQCADVSHNYERKIDCDEDLLKNILKICKTLFAYGRHSLVEHYTKSMPFKTVRY